MTGRSRSRAIAAVIGVAALALVALFVVSPSRTESDPGRQLVGGVAPDLAGTAMNGERFDIDDHRGQWVLVNFFATWCPPCVQEHPELVEFSERNAPAVQVVSVAYDDTELAKVEAFFRERGGDWPVLTDGAGGAAFDYAVKKLPESFLVDPSGNVAEKFNGAVTVSQLESTIAEHTADAAPAESGS